jgi:NADH-quinone oxidoreductase subunit I
MGTVKIKRPEVTWWERVYFPEILRGMAITIGHGLKSLFTPRSMPTVQYPEEKKSPLPRPRGRHLLVRREDGTPLCVACYCCQTVCPPLAIKIVAEESPDPEIEKRPKSFHIDLLRCIFCGMCVEACPKYAIVMTNNYELAAETREALRPGIVDLLEKEKQS